MDLWRKESLGLAVGDWIIWQDEAVELEGQSAVVTPGMKGEVISLHDGFHLDVAEVAHPAQGYCAVRERDPDGG